MTVMTKVSLAFLISALFILVFVLLAPSFQLKVIDGKYYKALHIRFPGMNRVGYPENVIKLKNWEGSKFLGLEVKVDGKNDPQLEAATALKALGIANDEYLLEQLLDGNWILRKPYKETSYFSLSSYVRISPYVLDEKQ